MIELIRSVSDNEDEEDDVNIATKSKDWKHEPGILNYTKNTGKRYFVDRNSVESACRVYLDMPIRLSKIDRILIDQLIAVELSSFADEMINPNPYGVKSPLKQQHILISFIIGFIINAIFFIGLAVGAFALEWEVVGIVILGIYVLITAVSVIALPFAWKKQSAARKLVTDLILSIDGVYREMGSSGPISARHIAEKAKKSSDLGVVWPAPLFAMLDDVLSRSGRI